MDKLGLQSFLKIIEKGSLTAAAKHLNTTPPTITRRIQNLEQAVGSRLFDRDHRTLSPTPAGEMLVPHAHGILRAMEQAQTEVLAGLQRLDKAKESRHSVRKCT
jgi:DNA-binding transcriptional LysR family regulator